MASSFHRALKAFEYALPHKLIAVKPAHPRDSARILAFDRQTQKLTLSTFRSLPALLPKGALLVFNETKVIPARLHVHRTTGGRVALLYLGRKGACVRALSSKKLKEGATLTMDARRSFVVQRRVDKEWILKPSFDAKDIERVLERRGEAPLPPYIKNSPLNQRERKREYQTVFAKNKGSIAAPTASLHFTKRLMNNLACHGIDATFVTLHVHLGTFAPLTQQQWKRGVLHEEQYVIPREARRKIERARKQGRPIIAVGTTVVRTLESAADRSGHIKNTKGTTDLFIRGGYRFKIIDGMITNFHVPRSSLLMLVGAFLGKEKLMNLYQIAIQKKFRFFSFGDGMLIV